MNSRNDQLRLFLKGFMELCARRRSGLHPSISKTLLTITAELEQDKTPALENLLDFENKYERMGQNDAHLRYLHCVLKGFRERTYRPSPRTAENQPL
ncbi:hypothetical protein BAC1_02413 [uncultured bacterium]|nr:hypothetical protein BAC1_02413 [uncultured bacterium]